MKKSDRDAASALESIMARHTTRQEALEVRTVADLHAAGFAQIKTVADAYERLEAQRELPGFTQVQIDMVLYQRRSREKTPGKAA